MLPPSPLTRAGLVRSRHYMVDHPAERWGHASPHPAKTIILLGSLPLTLGLSGSEPAVRATLATACPNLQHKALGGSGLGSQGAQKASLDFFKCLSV